MAKRRAARKKPAWRFERKAIAPFFAQVPALYAGEQAPIHKSYQELLYTVEHEFAPSDLQHIDRLMGNASPTWARGAAETAIPILDGARYPDSDIVATPRPTPGLSLRVASTYLHFFHHTYPVYHPDSVRGLAKLGAEIPWTMQREPAVYGDYVACIEELRERIPFWDVPEVNVHINRVLQAALAAWGRKGA